VHSCTSGCTTRFNGNSSDERLDVGAAQRPGVPTSWHGHGAQTAAFELRDAVREPRDARARAITERHGVAAR